MTTTCIRHLRRFGYVPALLMLVPSVLAAQERVREPLPLEVSISLHDHVGRAPINLSPDGEWIAHTVATDEAVPHDSEAYYFNSTGFSFSEGDMRRVATLTNVKTGEVIRLGGAKSSSWSPVWSPDGRRVAFYSDENGEAGVWVWEKATRTAKRFPGVIARPHFGFEIPRWSSDGERILVKILPVGMTIAEANALGPQQLTTGPKFPKVGAGEPSVIVRAAGSAEKEAREETPGSGSQPTGDTNGAFADLAILDLRTGAITRVAERVAVRWYAFSPNEDRVAYVILKGWQLGSQQPLFDLMVVDAAGRGGRRLGENLRMGYGTEWSWTPDGRMLSWIDASQLGEGWIGLVPVEGGAPRLLKPKGAPNFGKGEWGEGVYAPIWDPTAESIYVVGNGEIWTIDAKSGEGRLLARIPGWEIRTIVQPFGRPALWASDGGKTVWVVAREPGSHASGLFAIDRKSGKVRLGLREEKTYRSAYNLAGSEATGEIAFVSADQQHLEDIWLFDPKRGKARQATHINPNLERYELGQARLIEWKGREGETLKGALLLPPGYREGQRLPLVIWIYGGMMESRNVNTFGFWSTPNFNMHILATRGYAVLAPDAPVRTGHTLRDIADAANRAADAAIAQGYADPERLAIMGQSYGSYSVLSAITQTKRFKAAVITAAVLHPDLVAGYVTGPGYYEHGQGNMGGTIWEVPERYFENSPLFYFDKIETPLLIGQGELDGYPAAPDAVFTALERLGKPVEYRLYEGEDHVLMQPRHVLDFWKRRLEFLAEYLKLRPDAHGRVAVH